MNSNVHYKGIGNYNRDRTINYYKFLPVVFICFLVVAILIASKILNYTGIQHKDLSENSISSYIEVVDSVSKNRAQIDWQEVAAINEVINGGNIDENLNRIAASFLQTDGNSGYNILSLDEVIGKLNLNQKDIDKINNYLYDINGSTVYKELINDPVKIDFVENIKNAAMKSYKEYGVLPSITMAQAILESGWGTSELATEHNNLFGIKADKRWSGEVASITTKENYNDVIQANFRKYDSILQSIADHGAFLASNVRYTDNGVFSAENYKEQAQALENAGYSTAKNEAGEKIYADKLIALIQKYDLMGFDTEAQRRK